MLGDFESAKGAERVANQRASAGLVDALTQLTPDDPAAWYNLGLTLAWLGEQPKAVAALSKSIELETDDYRAEEAGALAEVLRCGFGMENDSDHVGHVVTMPIRDPNAVMQLLGRYEQTEDSCDGDTWEMELYVLCLDCRSLGSLGNDFKASYFY